MAGDEGMSRTQSERSEATRAQLLNVAQELFTEHGFDKTPLDLVAERAGVTKGALYHHFRNKRELFQAVFESLEVRLCEKVIEAAIAAGDDAWAGLQAGVRGFLEAALDPSCQRIVMLEGPSVLGWETWKEIDERYGYGLTKASLEAAMAAGVLERRPVDPLARLFLAAISEAAIQIARAPDREAEMEEMYSALMATLEGFRVRT
jgi:AcrR family transcriptional regulator